MSFYVIFECALGDEWLMSRTQADRFLEASNVLQHLVYGHQKMQRITHMDVFKRFGVSRKEACLLWYICAHESAPDDTSATGMLSSGRLREVNDALGGFPKVDEAIAKYEESTRAKHDSMEMVTDAIQHMNELQLRYGNKEILYPSHDKYHMYEWCVRFYLRTLSLEELNLNCDELQQCGFNTTTHCVDNEKFECYFRRLKGGGLATTYEE